MDKYKLKTLMILNLLLNNIEWTLEWYGWYLWILWKIQLKKIYIYIGCIWWYPCFSIKNLI